MKIMGNITKILIYYCPGDKEIAVVQKEQLLRKQKEGLKVSNSTKLVVI